MSPYLTITNVDARNAVAIVTCKQIAKAGALLALAVICRLVGLVTTIVISICKSQSAIAINHKPTKKHLPQYHVAGIHRWFGQRKLFGGHVRCEQIRELSSELSPQSLSPSVGADKIDQTITRKKSLKIAQITDSELNN